MEMLSQSAAGFRTVLMLEQAAVRFARCLDANPAFTEVFVRTSPRATSDRRYFVEYRPTNPERHQALLARQQMSRADRARTEGEEYLFCPDESGRFIWCFNPLSGGVYEVTSKTCSCEDWQFRCQHWGMSCKHQIALAEGRGTMQSGFIPFPAVSAEAPVPVAVAASASEDAARQARREQAKRDRMLWD